MSSKITWNEITTNKKKYRTQSDKFHSIKLFVTFSEFHLKRAIHFMLLAQTTTFRQIKFMFQSSNDALITRNHNECFASICFMLQSVRSHLKALRKSMFSSVYHTHLEAFMLFVEIFHWRDLKCFDDATCWSIILIGNYQHGVMFELAETLRFFEAQIIS